MSERSSISSSRNRIPTGRWAVEWTLAVTIFGLLALGWDAFWRSRGFLPGVDDSPRLWGATRTQVGPETTVLLGTSRAQAALDPRVWEEAWPGRPVLNLALEGRSPVDPLVTLAEERSYHGLTVVDLPSFFVFDLTPWKNDLAAALNEFHQARASPAVRWDARLRRASPEGIPFRLPELRVVPLLDSLLLGQLPGLPNFITRPDRFRPVVRDYQRHPPPPSDYDFFETWAHPAAPAVRDSIIGVLARAVRAIQARGGQVAFLQMPTCGEVRRLEEKNFPAVAFWDLARAGIPAPFLDERDSPALNGDHWMCADGSHLYVAESGRFTRETVALIQKAIETWN